MVLFPPKNLYRPQFTVALDVRKLDSSLSGEMQHAYVGKYEIGLQVAKRISMPSDSQKSNLRLAVRMSSSAGEIFATSIGDAMRPWWSHEANGFTLAYYWVPTDLPVCTPIHWDVTVKTPSTELIEMFGEVTLYVRKSSEK